jgi:hypothetical protein
MTVTVTLLVFSGAQKTQNVTLNERRFAAVL